MSNDLENALGELSEGLATLDCVGAIGLSGSDRSIPEPGEGDIDMQRSRGKLLFIGYGSNNQRVLAPALTPLWGCRWATLHLLVHKWGGKAQAAKPQLHSPYKPFSIPSMRSRRDFTSGHSGLMML